MQISKRCGTAYSSKSECNRALIIEALSNGKVKVENIHNAADAVLPQLGY